MAIVTIAGTLSPPGDVANLDIGGGTTVALLGYAASDTSTTGQLVPPYSGYQFAASCVTTGPTVVTITTTVSYTGAPWDTDEDGFISLATLDGVNPLAVTATNPPADGDIASSISIPAGITRGTTAWAATDTTPDAGPISYTVTVPGGTNLATLRVLHICQFEVPGAPTDNRVSAVPPSISFDDVACTASPVIGAKMFNPSTGHTYSPGVVCYALAGPLDCFGRPINLTDNVVVDLTDGAELYTPAVGKRTVMEVACHVKEIVMDEIRTDEVVISEGECDEQRIPGGLRGYAGDWVKSRFTSPDFDELIGLRRLLYSSGVLAASQPVEAFTVCACGAGCTRSAWWMLVWRQMLSSETSSQQPLLGPGGNAMWEVQLYPNLTVTGGLGKRKTSQSARLADLDEPTFTVRADRNTSTDWSGIVVPDGAGGFISLIPATVATVDGVSVDLSSQLGSELTRYTEVPPPQAGCDLVNPSWSSYLPTP